MQGIFRDYHIEPTVVIPTAANIATATAINFKDFVGGSVEVPAGSSLTTITYWACMTEDGTYLALYDKNNNPVTQTVAAERIYALKDEVFNCAFIKMTGNAAEAAAKVFLKA
jgi:hypothetical protein